VQIRVIFKLPRRFKSLQHLTFAYVELFTPFHEPNSDGFHIVKHSSRHGKRHSRVILLSEVVFGCHLTPAITGKVKDGWSSDNALDKGTMFHLNMFSNVLMYILINFSKFL
jgi:hypothetical protein